MFFHLNATMRPLQQYINWELLNSIAVLPNAKPTASAMYLFQKQHANLRIGYSTVISKTFSAYCPTTATL